LNNTLELAQSLNLEPLVLMFRYPAEKILGTTFDGLFYLAGEGKKFVKI